MTTNEFSDNFTTLLNSYYNSAEFGDQNSKTQLVLNEYEKSVLLTKAQEDIVLELYDNTATSFEESEKIRRILAPLIRTAYIHPFNWDFILEQYGLAPVSNDSYLIGLPDDLMEITLEQAIVKDKCKNSRRINVQPIKQDEFNKVKENPFRGCTDNRALRLDLFTIEGMKCIELVSIQPVRQYIVRYLKRPNPIILEDLPENLSINGETTEQTSELSPEIHQKILERAVYTAITSNKISNTTIRNQ